MIYINVKEKSQIYIKHFDVDLSICLWIFIYLFVDRTAFVCGSLHTSMSISCRVFCEFVFLHLRVSLCAFAIIETDLTPEVSNYFDSSQ